MDNDALYAPDILDFIIRRGSYYENAVLNHPGLITYHVIKGSYIICYSSLAAYTEMTELMGSDFINSVPTVLGPTSRPALEASGIIQLHQQPYLDLRGSGVLVGFVDTGIDYTQKVFQYEDGTSKIKFIYDQSIPGTPPSGFPLGTEYTQEEINAALASDAPYDIVPHRDVAGHGTFLASVAAGRPDQAVIGAAPDSEIIMVKLKKAYPYYLERFAVPPGQENAFEATDLMMGIEYIVKKATELHRPVAICLGLGSSYDSHDGFSPCEEYIFNLSNIPGICICASAGNESQSRHHFYKKFSPDRAPENIDIKVGDNAGDIFVIISNRISDRISVSVRSPTGELVGRVPAKAAYTLTTRLVLERAIVSVSYHFPIEGSGDQVTIVKIFNATPGIWTITAYGDIVLNGTIQAWLPLTGFVSPNVEFLLSDPYYTITYPATAFGSISCGAYDSNNASLDAQSSWGPTRLIHDNPDLVAPGTQIRGMLPTGVGYMSGTSIASAITSGACALLLQWAINKGNDFGFCTPMAKAYLIRGCNRSDTLTYPNFQWGYGSLNLLQTFYYMREL